MGSTLGWLPGLVNVYKKLWKITIFDGKNHYKLPFSIAMLIYQRVMRGAGVVDF